MSTEKKPQDSFADLRNLLNCFKSTDILVVVGGKKTEHWIPKALLFHYSRVCEERAMTTLDEGSIRVVELPECNDDDFEMVLRWIYTGRVLPVGFTKNHAAAYIRFFQIAELLELLGPFDSAKRELELALIKASRSDETTEKYDHIKLIRDAFKKPIHQSVHNLLARPLAILYLEKSLEHQPSFPSAFESLEAPLALEILKVVSSSLSNISLAKPDYDGKTYIKILCPLRKVDSGIVSEKLEIPIKFKPRT